MWLNVNTVEETGFLTGEALKHWKAQFLTDSSSVCQELIKHAREYDKTEEEVIEFAVEQIPNLMKLTDTAGMSLFSEGYVTSIEASFAAGFTYLQDSTGRVYIVTQCPDLSLKTVEALDRLKDYSPVLAICNNHILGMVYSLFVEPAIISSKAQQIATSMTGDSDSAKTRADSETRQLFNAFLSVGIKLGASDLHFIPCEAYCEVQYRVDGRYEKYDTIPLPLLQRVNNIILTDSGVGVGKDPHKPIDAKFRFSPSQGKVNGDEQDIRVSIMGAHAGPDIVLRYLSSRLFSFDDIGMSVRNVKLYKHLLGLPQGLVIQVGPVGSGKSTTLYSGLDYIHKMHKSIITAEDPVEIKMDGITQVDVDPLGQKNMTFADALRASLRHDPDVVVVGELRDRDTAEEALRAANTGHLVLTSLHTNDAIGVFERLINIGMDPYSIGEVLAAVIGQRLVRRLCPKCKRLVTIDPDDPKYKEFHLAGYWGHQPRQIYEACGCSECRNKGYKGRVAVNEVLVVDSTLRYDIQCRSKRTKYEDYLKKTRFETIYADALNRVADGTTSLEEIRHIAEDTMAFKGYQWGHTEKEV